MKLVYTWFITWMPLFLVYKPGNRLCLQPCGLEVIPLVCDEAEDLLCGVRPPGEFGEAWGRKVPPLGAAVMS